ncbi:MAG: glycosyltransferase family 25 protein [Crocinitomicaceae bacterium]
MSSPIKADKVYVVHVSSNLEREEHMKQELGRFNIPFEFMLKGDLKDLSRELVDEYFSGDQMSGPFCAEQSCALKHIYIYQKMIEDGVGNALIFEDDVFLTDNFIEVFNQCIDEFSSLSEEIRNKGLINFEESTLRYVPKERVKEGIVLYEMDRSRCAGAYFINSNLAKAIVNDVQVNKCDKPLDWYHNTLVDRIALKHFWCHPAIVQQGSHNGKMASTIDDKKHGGIRKITWKISRWYKQKIRPLFGSRE